MSDERKLEQFLETQQFMVLAVVLENGSPWAVPLRIRARTGNEFEWDSSLLAEHSKVLANGASASIAIYQKDDTVFFGFYANGRATLVEETKPGYGRYKFVAEQCFINDETFKKREVALS